MCVCRSQPKVILVEKLNVSIEDNIALKPRKSKSRQEILKAK